MRAIKNIRLSHYNYSNNGFYFVTICTNHKQTYLNGLIKNVVVQFIGQTEHNNQGVTIDYCEIAPTHIHLIMILHDCSLQLGEVVRRLKAITTKYVGFKLWQPNYYEHVIRNEKALEKIREYIINHPLKEKIKLEDIYKNWPDESGNYRIGPMNRATTMKSPMNRANTKWQM